MADTPQEATMAYDPDLAPPPDPEGDRRLLRIIGVLTVLLVLGLGFAFYERSQLAPKETSAAKAFLKDVQARNYPAASARLCPGAAVTPAKLTSELTSAAAGGRAIQSFKVVSGNSSQAIPGGRTAHVAQANVTFTNGQKGVATVLLRSSGGHLCVYDSSTENLPGN